MDACDDGVIAIGCAAPELNEVDWTDILIEVAQDDFYYHEGQ